MYIQYASSQLNPARVAIGSKKEERKLPPPTDPHGFGLPFAQIAVAGCDREAGSRVESRDSGFGPPWRARDRWQMPSMQLAKSQILPIRNRQERERGT